MAAMRSRRQFVGHLAAGAVLGLAGTSRAAGAEAPPETRTVRFTSYPAACIAPQWIAEDLLRADGFTDVRYVDVPDDVPTGKLLGDGKADFSIESAPGTAFLVDGGVPVTALAGIHAGCFELFAHAAVRTVRDLKGKRISVLAEGDDRHLFVAAMLALVGIDPRRDVQWDFRSSEEGMNLFAAGKVDAFLGFPPDPQELRARKIGHVVVDTLTDRPWSQYFCCMVVGRREFVRNHPAATKRVLRALLKATDTCGREPARVARFLAAKGYEKRRDYAAELLERLPYARWRDMSPEDTLRFYALRLHEAGLVKSAPQRLLAQGADWRLLTELKKELKG